MTKWHVDKHKWNYRRRKLIFPYALKQKWSFLESYEANREKRNREIKKPKDKYTKVSTWRFENVNVTIIQQI